MDNFRRRKSIKHDKQAVDIQYLVTDSQARMAFSRKPLKLTEITNLREVDGGVRPGTAASDCEAEEHDSLLLDSGLRDVERNSSREKMKKLLSCIKIFIGVIFFFIVLGSAILNKLTLIGLTSRLRSATFNSSRKDITPEERQTAVTFYWYLQLVLLIPNCITFLRCLIFGILGKTFPWPSLGAFVAGGIGSIAEVFAMTIFVYLILPEVSSGAGILLLSGIFVAQIAMDIYNTPMPCFGSHRRKCNCLQRQRMKYYRIHSDLQTSVAPSVIANQSHSICSIAGIIVENKIVKALALLFQLTGIFGFSALRNKLSGDAQYKSFWPIIGYPIFIFVMSIIWTNLFQEYGIAQPREGSTQNSQAKVYSTDDGREQSESGQENNRENLSKARGNIVSARYTSSFINSGIRLLSYPFVSYIIFRFASVHRIDPWCLNHLCEIKLYSDDLPIIIIQLVFTFTGYIIGWVSCTMILNRWSVSIPLLLSTPVTVVLYYLFTYVLKVDSKVFPYHAVTDQDFFGNIDRNVSLLYLTSILWLGQLTAMLYLLYFVKSNSISSRDSEMFLVPHYDAVFFEQHFILNWQIKKEDIYGNGNVTCGMEQRSETTYHHSMQNIFICSTMYRENETEMKQMLTSIYNVALHYSTIGDKTVRYESHIFFDGTITGKQIKEFGKQLLTLLEETLHVKLQDGKREKAPYGYRLTWNIGPSAKMPFTVHFKDPDLVKPKKRWSLVMCMNYVIKYRIKNEKLNPTNTFILTTDADIGFTPQSVEVLLDILASNAQIGGVCPRTTPKGFGLLYWYQIFDYAFRHWFQKPAEHVFGCVLCLPGCFSVLRCSALAEVLDEFSSEVVCASDFLMKDMGEDRWLCTLLIKKGWRLEYCAISEDQTYCPIEFGEFFRQRRRWTLSTIANLLQIMAEAMRITRRNDSVSILFIIYQVIMIFSTTISPATVILIIASGLQTTFKLSESVSLMIIAVLIIVSVLYGIICVISSPKTQIDLSMILTFIFGVIMMLMVVGTFKDIVYTGKHPILLQPTNCSNMTNTSNPDAESCKHAAIYITKSLRKPNTVITVSTNTIYFTALAVTFIVAGILHPKEFYCLFHGVWYLLGLPSEYLLLLIYSAANLDNQTWGTREGKVEEDRGLEGWIDKLKNCIRKSIKCCLWCCRKEFPKEEERKRLLQMTVTSDKAVQTEELTAHFPSQMIIRHPPMDQDTKEWLKEILGCEDDIHKFEDHGYINKHFIAAMTPEDFDAIGIESRGFSLRLQNATKQLPSLQIYAEIPDDVAVWLTRLELGQYTDLFKHNGYEHGDDVKNLKELKENDLKSMGITKRAHIQQLLTGIDNLINQTPLELKTRETETKIDNLPIEAISPKEAKFWKQEDICRVLKPISAHSQSQVKDFKQSLRSLRNIALGVIFLVNIMWIVLLYSLRFPELENYGFNKRGFQLFFLAVYSFVIIIQFIALICHRVVTMVHYLGHTKPEGTKGYYNPDIQMIERDSLL